MTYEDAKEYIPRVKTLYGSKDFVRGSHTAREWFEMVDKALDKQIPKRHIIELNSVLNKELICPSCFVSHGIYGDIYIPTTSNYCPFCGQAIDWSDEE